MRRGDYKTLGIGFLGYLVILILTWNQYWTISAPVVMALMIFPSLLMFIYMMNSWRFESTALIDNTEDGHSSICPKYDIRWMPAQTIESGNKENRLLTPSLVFLAKGGIDSVINIPGGKEYGIVICRPEHTERVADGNAIVVHANLQRIRPEQLPPPARTVLETFRGYNRFTPIYFGLTSTLDNSATAENINFESMVKSAWAYIEWQKKILQEKKMTEREVKPKVVYFPQPSGWESERR